MSASSRQHTGSNRSRKAAQADPRPARRPTIRIVEGRQLFTWIWNRLEETGPKIAVHGDVVACLDEIFEAIRDGRPISFPPLPWESLFAEVLWENVYDLSGYHSGPDMLGFIGKLCETIERDGGGNVSHVRACEMMLAHWDPGRIYLDYTEERSGVYLISTGLCELKFARIIKVKLTDEPLHELQWTLSGNIW